MVNASTPLAHNVTPDKSIALFKGDQNSAQAAAQKLKDAKDIEKVEEAAREFEAVFVAEMLKPMFEGLETDGMFGGGKGEEIFRGMMLQEYGKKIAETGGLGFADQIKAEMIRMQDVANNNSMTKN